MAEPSMAYGYPDFARRTGRVLGYGSTTASWTTEQTEDVDDVVQDGLDLFYHPPPLIPGDVAHRWTFLRPVTTLVVWPTITGTVSGTPVYDGSTYSTITAAATKFYPTMVGKSFVFTVAGTSYTIAGYTSGTIITVVGDASGEGANKAFAIAANGDYRMPDDFGGMMGGFVYNSWGVRIQICDSDRIRQLRAGSTASGQAQYAAHMPAVVDQTRGQRWDMGFWPIPNTIETLYYEHEAQPNKITVANPYPLGGAWHSRTMLWACFVIADEYVNQKRREQSDYWTGFLTRLEASVRQDRLLQAQTLGVNHDPGLGGGVVLPSVAHTTFHGIVVQD